MLETLRVTNFVLIDDVELHLQPGFTAITGETGAGKSLLVGALNLVLGERASGELVRPGKEQGSVEATFAYAPRSAAGKQLEAIVAEAGIEPEPGTLIIRRLLSADGRSRCFVNGSATVLKVVAALGEVLVDLHGQHAHQSLLRPGVYLQLLDDYGGLHAVSTGQGKAKPSRDLVAEVAEAYAERQRLREALAELSRDEEARLRELDMLRFQAKEIDGAQLEDPQEETALEQERERLRHAEQLHEHAARAYALLTEQENCASDLLGAAAEHVGDIAAIDPTLGALGEQLEQARTTLDECARALERYCDDMEHEPGRLDAIESRLHVFQQLERKYGGTLADVIAYGEQVRERLDALENVDSRREELQEALQAQEERLADVALQLHEGRQAAAKKLSRAIERVLGQLALKDATCDVRVDTRPDDDGIVVNGRGRVGVGPRGIDHPEFLLTTNPGAKPAPLRQIASGGELSRIMLAIKSALAQSSRVPTLIFDEIDIGVGGRTADAVGETMQALGEKYQVLSITHLPQIAARAAQHISVEKQTKGKQVVTHIRTLDAGERKAEIARMLGGAAGSREAEQHAAALLKSR